MERGGVMDRYSAFLKTGSVTDYIFISIWHLVISPIYTGMADSSSSMASDYKFMKYSMILVCY